MGTRIRLTKEDFHYWGFNLLNKWLEIRINGGSLSSFFQDNRLENIAIYGAGAIGRRLLEELKDCSVDVRCLIDRNSCEIADFNDVSVIGFEDNWPQLDAIIVTPIFFYEISESIRGKTGDNVNVIALDDVIDYCYADMMR